MMENMGVAKLKLLIPLVARKTFWNSGTVYRLDSNALPFKGPKMFWAGPNFLRLTKNLFTYCGSRKHFVPDKKMICIQ